MNTRKHRSPAALTLHPLLKSQPGEWQDDDPRFESLIQDIRENGILDPIKITAANQIVDGRHRWRAAKKAKLEEIPFEIIPDDQIAAIILRSLLHRRHYTKGQLAYLAAPLMVPTFEEAMQRKLQNLRKGQQTPEAHSVRFGERDMTMEQLAAQLNVSPRLIDQAHKIHEEFELHPDWRASDEPKILDPDDPAGLGAIIAGFAGRVSTKSKPKPAARQLQLFEQAITDLETRFTYWKNFDDDQKRTAIAPLASAVETMPDDLLNQFARTIRAEQKRRES